MAQSAEILWFATDKEHEGAGIFSYGGFLAVIDSHHIYRNWAAW